MNTLNWMICCPNTARTDATIRREFSICSGPPPAGLAKPITLRDKRPAYGSNSWLSRHKSASPLIFDP
jgi:hypothetical protein